MDIHDKLDIIFLTVDTLCYQCDEFGDWSDIRKLISGVRVSEISHTEAIAWLTVTNCIKDRFDYTSLYNAVAEHVKNLPDNRDKRLLRGLEP